MESYRSKDFIVKGSYLSLDPEKAWEKIDKRMRTAVRKAAQYNPRVVQINGNEEDIKKFAKFCPRADTLPKRISEEQLMFFCYIEEELVAGLILAEIAGNLFLQFNAVTDSARKKQISSFLLWKMVEIFANSKYKYLDIGANYRVGIQRFFEGWCSKEYPIMMKPPEIKPQLRIAPFENKFLQVGENEDINASHINAGIVKRGFEENNFTVFPRAMYAIYSLIKSFKLEGKLDENDEICIKTTSGSKYISGCVTSAIEETCKWSEEINEKTKAVLVIHEFGFFNSETPKLREICNERNIPLIEDCAYLWAGGRAGYYGDYLIYSATKIFPMQFGGILVGKTFEPDYIWNNFACYDKAKSDIVLKQLNYYLPKLEEYNKKRLENYKYYVDIFREDRTFFKVSEFDIPGAFVLKVENEKRAQEIAEYVNKFGIECGVYWGNSAIFFPVHQILEKPQLDYIIAAVLAMFRNGNGIYGLPEPKKDRPSPEATDGKGEKMSEIKVENVDIAESANIRDSKLNNVSVGEDTKIRDSIVFGSRENQVKIGKNCYIGSFCYIDGHAGLEIGDNVSLAPGVKIFTDSGPNGGELQRIYPIQEGKIKIGNDVWLCANVSVLPGVTIGNRVIVGANSVVHSDIPDGVIVKGNPAKVVKNI